METWVFHLLACFGAGCAKYVKLKPVVKKYGDLYFAMVVNAG